MTEEPYKTSRFWRLKDGSSNDMLAILEWYRDNFYLQASKADYFQRISTAMHESLQQIERVTNPQSVERRLARNTLALIREMERDQITKR